jgi:nucleotide-binding universal stress UspA family protein
MVPAMLTIRKILCPTDFSEPSEAGWAFALTLAEQFGAEVILLHVVPEPVGNPIAYEMGYTPERFLRSVTEEATRLLADLAAKAGDWKVTIRQVLRRGVEFREVNAAAKEEGADLIVMGTHGRTGLAHLLIGSVAEKVVRTAPCPVLTVKHPTMQLQTA